MLSFAVVVKSFVVFVYFLQMDLGLGFRLSGFRVYGLGVALRSFHGGFTE